MIDAVALALLCLMFPAFGVLAYWLTRRPRH